MKMLSFYHAKIEIKIVYKFISFAFEQIFFGQIMFFFPANFIMHYLLVYFYFSSPLAAVLNDTGPSGINMHYPRVVEKNEKGQKRRRRCVLCSSLGLGQKRTGIYCADCPGQPALCPDTCFITYHATQL